MIRRVEDTDLFELQRIHKEFYAEEFPFPEFLKQVFNSFVILDEDGRIISASIVKPILEIVSLTDKNRSVRIRRDALAQSLLVAEHVAKHEGFQGFHAFIQDREWEKHLKRYGFQDTKGKSLVYIVE